MSRSLLLAELLRQYRTEAHLSQEELAERAGIAARTIGDFETGVSLSPRAITISLLSEALGLDGKEEKRYVLHRGGEVSPSVGTCPKPLVGREAEQKRPSLCCATMPFG